MLAVGALVAPQMLVEIEAEARLKAKQQQLKDALSQSFDRDPEVMERRFKVLLLEAGICCAVFLTEHRVVEASGEGVLLVLDQLAELAPREMRRALMTGFGNARLAGRGEIQPADLPRATGRKTAVGFIQ